MAFVDELEDARPMDAAIVAAREIIGGYPDCRVIGHREVISGTACPGNLFLGEAGWKSELTCN